MIINVMFFNINIGEVHISRQCHFLQQFTFFNMFAQQKPRQLLIFLIIEISVSTRI